MNVATILKQKGRSVATIAPAATLQEVTRRLAQRRIGALVVVGARKGPRKRACGLAVAW